MFIKFQVKLPSNCLSSRIFSFTIGKGNTELNQLEVIAICLYLIVFEFIFNVWWQVNCAWKFRIHCNIVVIIYKPLYLLHHLKEVAYPDVSYD